MSFTLSRCFRMMKSKLKNYLAYTHRWKSAAKYEQKKGRRNEGGAVYLNIIFQVQAISKCEVGCCCCADAVFKITLLKIISNRLFFNWVGMKMHKSFDFPGYFFMTYVGRRKYHTCFSFRIQNGKHKRNS